MKAQKFIFLVALSSVMALVMAACGGDDPIAPPTPTPIDTGAIVQQAVQEALTAAEKQLDEATAAAAKAREADAAAAQAAVAKALTAAEKAAAEAQKAAVAEALAAAEKRLADATIAAEKARDAAAAAAAATAAAAAAAAAAPVPFDAATYFSGKTIKIVVGFSPGGGYDTSSRWLASVMGDHFPGKPNFVVSNLPGSGGLRGLQAVMKADPNGLTVIPMASRFIVPEVIGEDVPGFDLFKANLVGTPTFTGVHQAYCIRRDIATTWQEVLDSGKTVLAGTSSHGGDLIGPELVEYLGGPIKVIFGYNGTSEVQAAVDRKELSGTTRCNFNYVQNLFPEWIENDTIVPLFWWRSEVSQEWLDALGAEAPPYLFDIVKATQEQQDAFNLGDIAESMTRMWVLAPDTPDEIVAVWRKAFKATVEDPKFIEKAAAGGLETGYGDPQVLAGLLEKGQGFGKEGKDLLRYLYGIE
jgi:hypothetical protein